MKVVAFADGGYMSDFSLLLPTGYSSGQAQPDLRFQFDDIGRGQVVGVRSRTVQNLDGPPRSHPYLDSGAGGLDLQHMQGVSHGHGSLASGYFRVDGHSCGHIIGVGQALPDLLGHIPPGQEIPTTLFHVSFSYDTHVPIVAQLGTWRVTIPAWRGPSPGKTSGSPRKSMNIQKEEPVARTSANEARRFMLIDMTGGVLRERWVRLPSGRNGSGRGAFLQRGNGVRGLLTLILGQAQVNRR